MATAAGGTATERRRRPYGPRRVAREGSESTQRHARPARTSSDKSLEGPGRRTGDPCPRLEAPVSDAKPRAILQALFVTFLWSTSWVLIEIGLDEIPALVFAGLRYATAVPFLLVPLLMRGPVRRALVHATRRQWALLGLLGVLQIALAQGSQFLALALLPTVAVSLALSATPVAVGLAGWAWLGERPAPRAWAGIAVYLAGALLYLLPIGPGSGSDAARVGIGAEVTGPLGLGLLVLLVGLLANAGGALTGRALGRSGALPALAITTASMAIGATLLLTLGLIVQGVPDLGFRGVAIVLWLAGVNTAFAFTLWNHTLRTLDAVSSSVINNTMLIQIAILAWAVLGQRLTPVEIVGLGLAAVGTLVVQWPERAGTIRPSTR